MSETSTIKYDPDHPHEMEMVWEVWLEYIRTDDWPDSNINSMYDNWITGKVQLIVPQAEWSRIVATYL